MRPDGRTAGRPADRHRRPQPGHSPAAYRRAVAQGHGWIGDGTSPADVQAHLGGLAGRLVRAVAAGIVARGETPFLHAMVSNANAIRLYEALGFELRRTSTFTVLEQV